MNMVPLTVYANPDLDVTDRLIEYLKGKVPAEAAEPVEN